RFHSGYPLSVLSALSAVSMAASLTRSAADSRRSAAAKAPRSIPCADFASPVQAAVQALSGEGGSSGAIELCDGASLASQAGDRGSTPLSRSAWSGRCVPWYVEGGT